MKALASIYLSDDDRPFVVTTTPSETVEIIERAIEEDKQFAAFTLGNKSDWNGKPLYVNPHSVVAISPPKDIDDEGD